MFWSRDLPHMVRLMKRDRGGTFKPLYSQTFVIISPRSICQMLANFSEAEF